MTRIFNIRLLTLICFVMSMGILTSCDKDDDVNSGMVELLSFGPTGAMHGDTMRIVGNNLTQVTEVQLTGATVAKADFKKHTAEEIHFIVPASTVPGYITLVTPDGNITSKTRLNLEVMPTIATVTPEARPGSNITITGNYLNWVTRVTFANDKVVDSAAFVSKSINQLVVTVPEDARTGNLVLAYGGTEPKEVETATPLTVTLPMVTGMAPNPVKHQTDLTITGTNLDLVKQIRFTGVTAPVTTFVSQTATQLVVKVPAGAQKGKISLVAASGVATQSTADMDVVLPAVTAMTPNPADPGANITITGTNLDLVSSITFPNAPAVTTFVSKTANQIVVRVPTGVLRGKLTLGVLNSTLTVQTPDNLEITGDVPPPSIAFPIYTDAVTNNWTSNSGWIGGGWGGTSNRDNTAAAREGSKSVQINYVGGYGSPFQLGGANISLAPYRTFNISVFGAPGSGGKRITIGINSVNDKYNITVVEGKWTDYAIPLSTLTSDATLKEIWVQEFSGTGGFTVYVDAIGLN